MQPILTLGCLLVVVGIVTSQIRNVQIPPGAMVELDFEFINPNSGGAQGEGGSGGAHSQGGSMGMAGQMNGMGGNLGHGGRMMNGMGGVSGQMMSGMGGAQGQMMNGMGGVHGMMSPMQVVMRTMAPNRMMSQMTTNSQMSSQMGSQMSQQPSSQGQTQQQPGSPGQMTQPSGTPGQMPQTPPMQTPGSALQQLLTNMLNMALSLRRMYGMNIPTPLMEEPCPCGADCCSMPMEPRRVLPVFNIPMTMHRGCCGCIDCPISLSHLVTNMVQNAQSTPAPTRPAPVVDKRK
ncbi:hypothetical protein ACF0H5_019222 [Mactra antiquata]